MKRFFESEAGAVVLWMVSSLLLAAVISPWAYQAGKALAAAADSRDLPGILEWLGASCRKAKFGRFYSRSLLFSALVFLPLLFLRIRKLCTAGGTTTTSRLKISCQSGFLQIAVGCVIAGGMVWGLAMILHAAGAYAPDPHPLKIGRLLAAVLVPAVAAPLVEETLFRGVLLGLWLKSQGPVAACWGTSFVFAFLHFLDPPAGFVIAHPEAPIAGFQLLGGILFHFTNPRFFVTDFATLFAVGLILAWARVRTGGLWFSIGLHAGWVAAFKCCNIFFMDVADHPLRPWGVGDNIRSGLLPMIALGLTAIICHYALKRFDQPRTIA